MKEYKVEIQFKDYHPMKKQWEEKCLSGYFKACNADKAAQEAKTYYASELGESPEHISVLTVLEL